MAKGIYVAQLVPYGEDGDILEGTLREWVRYNVEANRADGLYVGGSTGESFLSSAEERERTLRIVAEEARGKIALIAQVGCLHVREALSLAEAAAGMGYDAVSAVTPFYYNFAFEETLGYYRALAARTDLPLVVYAVPALTGKPFGIPEARKFMEIPGIAGIKFTSPDLFLLERILAAFPGADIFNGYDELLLPALSVGAEAAIGSTYNVFAPVAKGIVRAAAEGRAAEARRLQGLLNAAISELAPLGLYQALKLILADRGLGAGLCKAPFKVLGAEAAEKAVAVARRTMEQAEAPEGTAAR